MRERLQDLVALLDRCGPSLYTLLARLTLRNDVAEELMQELFLRLSRSGRLREADDPVAYVHRAARNLAFDWRRKEERKPAQTDLVPEILAVDLPPMADLIRAEELQQILDAAGRLSPACREVFVMRFVQELSYEAIGRQLGKTPHQVRSLCHKAIKRIREQVFPRPRETGDAADAQP